MDQGRVNLTKLVGNSTRKNSRSSFEWFNKYLIDKRIEGVHVITDLTRDMIVDNEFDLLGDFSAFLWDQPTIKKWSPHSNYLIPVVAAFKKNMGKNTRDEAALSEIYTTLRSRTETQYTIWHNDHGTNPVDHHEPIDDIQLKYTSNMLFRKQDYYLNCMYVMDYQAMARVSEGKDILWSSLALAKKVKYSIPLLTLGHIYVLY